MSHTIRCSILGADEDLPRLVQASGRSCDGGLVVLLWMPGDALLAHRGPKRETFEAWKAVNNADAPQVPTGAESPKTIARVMKHIKDEVGGPRPATLRGRWSGVLHCGDRPALELKRTWSQYGTMTLRSGPGGWTGTFERREGWFAKASVIKESGTLFENVFRALFANMMGLVQEACSAKDTRRRAAFDPDYAAAHPARPAREARDPVGRLIERWSEQERAEKPRKAEKAPKAPPAEKPPKAPKAQVASKPPKKPGPSAPPAPAAAAPAKAPKAKAPPPAPPKTSKRPRGGASKGEQYTMLFKGALRDLAKEISAEAEA